MSLMSYTYLCPVTGKRVQAWLAEPVAPDMVRFDAIDCIACGGTHLINPTTGKLMGDEEE
jgi:hypothetical protein